MLKLLRSLTFVWFGVSFTVLLFQVLLLVVTTIQFVPVALLAEVTLFLFADWMFLTFAVQMYS